LIAKIQVFVMLKRYIKAYNEAVFETDKEAAFTAVSAALTQGVKAEDIVFKIVIPTVEEIVDTAIAREAQVIAVSAMMAHTATGEDGARKVRRLLKERGLERCCKLIVGGAPYRYDTELYQSVGADSWAPDGINAARAIIDLIQKVKST
jgi:methanogenic corrinoid protein MtbC1